MGRGLSSALVGFGALLTIVTTAWNLHEPLPVAGLPDLVREDPDMIASSLRRDFADGEMPTQSGFDRLFNAARYDPLGGGVYFAGALNYLSKGDYHNARPWLEWSRTRQPRLLEARLLLLDGYLREEKAELAMDEVIRIHRMMRPASREMVDLAVGLLASAPERAPLQTMLADSDMAVPVAQQLSNIAASPYDILALKPQEAEGVEGMAHTANRLSRPYIDRGDYDAALILWRAFYPNRLNDGVLLKNGSFKNDPAPPFDWTFDSGRNGFAERGNERLYAQYYGEKSPVMASQLLMLEPGSYKLQVKLEEGGEREHGFVWRVRCHQENESLFQSRMTREGLAGSGFFTVPEDCPAQWLTLEGRPMEFPKVSRMTVTSVDISRMDDAA